MSFGTITALASLYEIRERKAEEHLSCCRLAMHEALAALEKARADYLRFRELVARQEEDLYRQVMAKVARKRDFETLKERLHLLKLQLQKRFDRVLTCDREHQEACEAFEAARGDYYAVRRKQHKLGEVCDDLRRVERTEALRKEGLELEEFTPRPSAGAI